MTQDYADAQRRYYLKETPQIQKFLAAPGNSGVLRQYETTIEEFQLRIIAKRKDYRDVRRGHELFGRFIVQPRPNPEEPQAPDARASLLYVLALRHWSIS